MFNKLRNKLRCPSFCRFFVSSKAEAGLEVSVLSQALCVYTCCLGGLGRWGCRGEEEELRA